LSLERNPGLLERIASDDVLDSAFVWLCNQREDYSANNDVWRLRQDWVSVKAQIHDELLTATYRFLPVARYPTTDGAVEVWRARDALVLKAIALVLTDHLAPRLSAHCYHLADRGGAKAAVRVVADALPANAFVMRSDVKGYYASLNHQILMTLLRQQIADERLLILLYDSMQRTVCEGGVYLPVRRGISLGCALSPLLGALYLSQLDERMAKTGLIYARFMDDWVVLAPTRWKLRAAVRIVNRTLDELHVEQHPDKTFIGRSAHGFDFLGYHITTTGLAPATQSQRNFVQRIAQLFEQGADINRIGQYVAHWLRWLGSGIGTRLADWIAEQGRMAVPVVAQLADGPDTQQPRTLASMLRSLTDFGLIFPGCLFELGLGDRPKEQPIHKF
jgi:hypothetical protein